MPLPPKGDPRRPLQLAVRSTRLLGGLLVLLGFCGSIPVMFVPGVRGGDPLFTAIILIGAAAYFVPGMLYIVFSIYLGHRKPWAVVATIVLASIQLLFVLLGIAVLAVTFALPHSDLPPTALVPVGIAALLAAALAQLIYHLSKSFESIRYEPVGASDRGFEPLAVRPATAPEPVRPTATGVQSTGDADAAAPQR